MIIQNRSLGMNYNIPKTFTMGGQTVKVKLMKTIPVEGAVGLCKFFENEILIQTHTNGKPMAKTQVEQIFYHEFMHYLFDQCRREDLSTDENLVDLAGEFLYQSLGHKKWR